MTALKLADINGANYKKSSETFHQVVQILSSTNIWYSPKFQLFCSAKVINPNVVLIKGRGRSPFHHLPDGIFACLRVCSRLRMCFVFVSKSGARRSIPLHYYSASASNGTGSG